MPNVKVYMDEALAQRMADGAEALLLALRGHICGTLGVDERACHIVLQPVLSAPGQPAVNIELAILRRTDRTRDRIAALCDGLRDLVARATGAEAAIRCALMEADHYIVAR